jgi:hypothetical protein
LADQLLRDERAVAADACHSDAAEASRASH